MDRVFIPKVPNDYRLLELRSELSELQQDLEGSIKFRWDAYRVGVSQSTDRWLNSSLEIWIEVGELVERTIGHLSRLSVDLVERQEDGSKTKKTLIWQIKNSLKKFLDLSRPSFESQAVFVRLESIYRSQLCSSSST